MRRASRSLTTFAVLVAIAFALTAAAAAAAADKPNILVIFGDDIGIANVSCL